ncbi:MAG: hypothetical protein E3J56_08100 [Candidatus Aminicenantes bacterium]|nr:MAG: hypothetical protein E3J56_08100 [Candidatus Aminicenantes bacterium]
MKKRNLTLLFMIILLIAVALIVLPGQRRKIPTVAEINAAIKAKGACWIAKENKFTHWTFEELKAMLGTFPEETAADEFEAPGKATGKPEKPPGKPEKPPKQPLPTSFDWSDNNGNWVTPVRDQGYCGSCWAFATVAQMESLIRIFYGNPFLDVDLSEQFIVSCDTSNHGCSGGRLQNVYQFVQHTGTPDEDCFLYLATDEPCYSPLRCDDWANRVEKIKMWKWAVLRLDTNKLKKVVFENGPVTCFMHVYYDLVFYESGCYEHVDAPWAGGHAVCIVGWTEEGCWIVKNSWGDDWGENGFFRIKFGNCKIGSQAGTFKYSGSR